MISIFNWALRICKHQATAIRLRDVRPLDAGAPQPPPPPGPDKPASNGDNALSQLAKLAPSEVMTVYLAGKAAFPAEFPLKIFAATMLVLCFIWRSVTTHEDGKPTQWMTIASASVPFGLWACASDAGSLFGTAFKPAMAGFIAASGPFF